jgi:hypothetical protein
LKIIIKISADGTRKGRKDFLVNFTFVIINDKLTGNSAFGNYTLGVGEIHESYPDLIEPFGFLMEHIKNFKSFKFKKVEVSFKYMFGADMAL